MIARAILLCLALCTSATADGQVMTTTHDPVWQREAEGLLRAELLRPAAARILSSVVRRGGDVKVLCGSVSVRDLRGRTGVRLFIVQSDGRVWVQRHLGTLDDAAMAAEGQALKSYRALCS